MRHKEGYRIPRTRHPALSHPCALTAARAPSSPKPRGGHLEAQLCTHSPRSGIKCAFPSAGRWKGETTSPDSAGEFLRTSHTSLAILLTFPHLVYRPTPAPCITFVTEDVSDRRLGDGPKERIRMFFRQTALGSSPHPHTSPALWGRLLNHPEPRLLMSKPGLSHWGFVKCERAQVKPRYVTGIHTMLAFLPRRRHL